MSRAFSFSLVMALWAACGLAQRAPEPPLNPKTYTSESGRYQLRIDPSHIHGQGSGAYRMTVDGKEAWTATLPYTLCDAGIADDGTVGGYGYTYGIEGFADEGRPNASRDDYGDFIVAILAAADGKPHLEDRTRRQGSRFLHADPTPWASGMFLDLANDRLVVRVPDEDLNKRDERWRVYALSTGKRAEDLRPMPLAGKDVSRCVDARPVPGTGLLLVQWWIYDGTAAGARFSLIDRDGKPAWSLDRPADYDSRTQRNPYEHGIVNASRPNRFAVRFVKENERVEFEVRREEGWKVNEAGRAPFVDPNIAASSQPTSQYTGVAKIDLKHFGTISLGASDKPRSIRRVRDFRIDVGGRIGFERLEDDGKSTAVFVKDDGTLLREIKIDGWDENTLLRPIGRDRWLATAAGYGEDAKARAWWVDAQSGKVEPIDGFVCPPIERAAATGDAGFVVITNLHQRYTIEESVIAFDARARQLWRFDSESGRESHCFAPHDVTTNGRGEVVLLDHLGRQLELFDRKGKFLRSQELAKVIGHEPNYGTDVTPDEKDGVIFHDFGDDERVWCLRRDGKAGESFRPQFADGRTFRLYGSVQRSPVDGSLWTSDGDCLLKLNDRGVVQRVLGEAPRADKLTEVSTAMLDRDGRIYAVAARTGAVHVFDRTGKPQFVCTPDAKDFASDARPELITIDGDGNIYIATGDSSGETRYVRFDRTGRRSGMASVTEDSIHGWWLFKPGSLEKWARGYRNIYLVDASGTIKRTIARRANGTWLDTVGEIAVAPDGGLAATSSRISVDYDSPATITTYTPTGDPIRTLPLPARYAFALAYDGRRIFVASTDGVFILNADTGQTTLFTPPGHVANHIVWTPMIPPNGSELWLRWRGSNRIERFAIP